jgi:hypothetical protein
MRLGGPAFTVESFEYVDAGPLALLRLAGRWRGAPPSPDDVVLVARTGGERIELGPLPAPPADDGLWRAAYSADADMLSDGAGDLAFELEPPAGRSITLPSPTEHAPQPPSRAGTTTPPQPQPLAPTAGDLSTQLAEELRTANERMAELMNRIASYEHSREELEAVQQELSAALDDLDAVNSHLDTVHEAHSLELGAARQQRDAAEQRAADLQHQLEEARAQIDEMHAQLAERGAVIEKALVEAQQAGKELEELHAATARLRDAIAARARQAAAAPQRRFSRDPDALRAAREQLQRDAERIETLERQAEALREAIHSQLPYALHASPLQEALPLSDEAEHEPELEAPHAEPGA